MKLIVGVLSVFAAVAAVYCAPDSKHTPPKVQVYSRYPGKYEQKNTLICQVSDFHPPDISIQLLMDGVELDDASLTDLAFKGDWHFHLTKSAPFTPEEGKNITCKVTHGTNVHLYGWEPNM